MKLAFQVQVSVQRCKPPALHVALVLDFFSHIDRVINSTRIIHAFLSPVPFCIPSSLFVSLSDLPWLLGEDCLTECLALSVQWYTVRSVHCLGSGREEN